MFDALVSPGPAVRWNRAAVAALLSHVVLVVLALAGSSPRAAEMRSAHRDTVRLDMASATPAPPLGSKSPRPGLDDFVPDPPAIPDLPLEAMKLPQLGLTEHVLRDTSRPSVLHPVGRLQISRDSSRLMFKATDVDELPELLHELRPRYPEGLRRAGVSGLVQVEYVVDIEGRMDRRSVRVVASTHPGFVLAALQALRRAHFKPARRGGRRVAVLVQQTIRFRFQ
jgi:TonB family protein